MSCRICGSTVRLERHHIISRNQIKKKNLIDVENSQGNLVTLCKKHHELTTASIMHRWHNYANSADKAHEELMHEIRNLRGRNQLLAEKLEHLQIASENEDIEIKKVIEKTRTESVNPVEKVIDKAFKTLHKEFMKLFK